MSDGKQEGGTEVLVGWGILLIILLIVLYFVYRSNAPEILNLIRWVRYGELWVVAALTPADFTLTQPDGEKVLVEELLAILKNADVGALDANILGVISRITMVPIKWLSVIVITLIGLWAYTKGPGTQYTQIFTLDTFIKFQSNAFNVIAPFINFNPNKQTPRPPGSDVPAELPPFAEALGPEEWLAYNQIPIKDQKIDKNAAFKAFATQLGPRWRGYKHLSPDKQVLLASCCLKASRKREKSDEMIGRLAKCWSHKDGLQLSREPGLLKEARKVLGNKDLSHATFKKCNQHAWETTALLRGLLSAREDGGVMAPAQFVWMRAHNRLLWYPLNNLGRQSNHIEAVGAIAHFKAEKRAQRPIPKAKVQDAVTSIINYMESGNARPVPTLDYSKSSNKRGIKKLKEA